MSKTQKSLVFVTVALLALVAGLALRGTDTPTGAAQPAAIATAFQTPLSTPEGGKASLAQWKGKVLVVNFWATWCVPCLREVPDLLKLESEFESRGVKLIGVAVDDPAPGAVQVEQFRRKYFPAFLTYARTGPEMDELASVIDPTWNEVVPTTYIIDRRGKAVARIQGKKSLEEFRTALEKAL